MPMFLLLLFGLAFISSTRALSGTISVNGPAIVGIGETHSYTITGTILLANGTAIDPSSLYISWDYDGQANGVSVASSTIDITFTAVGVGDLVVQVSNGSDTIKESLSIHVACKGGAPEVIDVQSKIMGQSSAVSLSLTYSRVLVGEPLLIALGRTTTRAAPTTMCNGRWQSYRDGDAVLFAVTQQDDHGGRAAALQQCRDYGGHLAQVADQMDFDFYAKYLHHSPDNQQTFAYVGVKRQTATDPWLNDMDGSAAVTQFSSAVGVDLYLGFKGRNSGNTVPFHSDSTPQMKDVAKTTNGGYICRRKVYNTDRSVFTVTKSDGSASMTFTSGTRALFDIGSFSSAGKYNVSVTLSDVFGVQSTIIHSVVVVSPLSNVAIRGAGIVKVGQTQSYSVESLITKEDGTPVRTNELSTIKWYVNGAEKSMSSSSYEMQVTSTASYNISIYLSDGISAISTYLITIDESSCVPDSLGLVKVVYPHNRKQFKDPLLELEDADLTYYSPQERYLIVAEAPAYFFLSVTYVDGCTGTWYQNGDDEYAFFTDNLVYHYQAKDKCASDGRRGRLAELSPLDDEKLAFLNLVRSNHRNFTYGAWIWLVTGKVRAIAPNGTLTLEKPMIQEVRGFFCQRPNAVGKFTLEVTSSLGNTYTLSKTSPVRIKLHEKDPTWKDVLYDGSFTTTIGLKLPVMFATRAALTELTFSTDVTTLPEAGILINAPFDSTYPMGKLMYNFTTIDPNGNSKWIEKTYHKHYDRLPVGISQVYISTENTVSNTTGNGTVHVYCKPRGIGPTVMTYPYNGQPYTQLHQLTVAPKTAYDPALSVVLAQHHTYFYAYAQYSYTCGGKWLKRGLMEYQFDAVHSELGEARDKCTARDGQLAQVTLNDIELMHVLGLARDHLARTGNNGWIELTDGRSGELKGVVADGLTFTLLAAAPGVRRGFFCQRHSTTQYSTFNMMVNSSWSSLSVSGEQSPIRLQLDKILPNNDDILHNSEFSMHTFESTYAFVTRPKLPETALLNVIKKNHSIVVSVLSPLDQSWSPQALNYSYNLVASSKRENSFWSTEDTMNLPIELGTTSIVALVNNQLSESHATKTCKCNVQVRNPCRPDAVNVSTIRFPYNGKEAPMIYQLDAAPISYTGNPVFLAEYEARFYIEATYDYGKCAGLWYQYEGREYMFVNTLSTWPEAEAVCEKHGAVVAQSTLLDVQTTKTLALFRQLAGFDDRIAWVHDAAVSPAVIQPMYENALLSLQFVERNQQYALFCERESSLAGDISLLINNTFKAESDSPLKVVLTIKNENKDDMFFMGSLTGGGKGSRVYFQTRPKLEAPVNATWQRYEDPSTPVNFVVRAPHDESYNSRRLLYNYTWNSRMDQGFHTSDSATYSRLLIGGEHLISVDVKNLVSEISATGTATIQCMVKEIDVPAVRFPHNGSVPKFHIMSELTTAKSPRGHDDYVAILANHPAYFYTAVSYNGKDECSGNWLQQNDGNLHLEYYLSDDQLSYDDAKVACRQKGAKLASHLQADHNTRSLFTLMLEHRGLLAEDPTKAGSDSASAWIGINRYLASDKKWTHDRDPVRTFAPCVPEWIDHCSGYNGGDRMAALLVDTSTLEQKHRSTRLRPTDMSEKHYYFCQRASLAPIEYTFKFTGAEGSQSYTSELSPFTTKFTYITPDGEDAVYQVTVTSPTLTTFGNPQSFSLNIGTRPRQDYVPLVQFDPVRVMEDKVRFELIQPNPADSELVSLYPYKFMEKFYKNRVFSDVDDFQWPIEGEYQITWEVDDGLSVVGSFSTIKIVCSTRTISFPAWTTYSYNGTNVSELNLLQDATILPFDSQRDPGGVPLILSGYPAYFLVDLDYPPFSTSTCRGRWLQFEGMEYYVSDEKVPFEDAAQKCVGLGARLATAAAENDEKRNLLGQLLLYRGVTESVWVGLKLYGRVGATAWYFFNNDGKMLKCAAAWSSTCGGNVTAMILNRAAISPVVPFFYTPFKHTVLKRYMCQRGNRIHPRLAFSVVADGSAASVVSGVQQSPLAVVFSDSTLTPPSRQSYTLSVTTDVSNYQVTAEKHFKATPKLTAPLIVKWPSYVVVGKEIDLSVQPPYNQFPADSLRFTYILTLLGETVGEYNWTTESSVKYAFPYTGTYYIHVMATDGRSEIHHYGKVGVLCGTLALRTARVYYPYDGRLVPDELLSSAEPTELHLTGGAWLGLSRHPMLFLTSTSYTGVHADCNGDWVQLEDYEYFVSDVGASSYANATAMCALLRARVAMLLDRSDAGRRHVVMIREARQLSEAVLVNVFGDGPTLVGVKPDFAFAPYSGGVFRYICERPTMLKQFELKLPDDIQTVSSSPLRIILNATADHADVKYSGVLKSIEMSDAGQPAVAMPIFFTRPELTEPVTVFYRRKQIIGYPVEFVIGPPYDNWHDPLKFIYKFTLVTDNQLETVLEVSNRTTATRYTTTFAKMMKINVEVFVSDDRSEIAFRGILDMFCGAKAIRVANIRYPYSGKPFAYYYELSNANPLEMHTTQGNPLVLSEQPSFWYIELEYPGGAENFCVGKWVQYLGKEYRFMSEAKSLREAKQLCKEQGPTTDIVTFDAVDRETREFVSLVREFASDTRSLWVMVDKKPAVVGHNAAVQYILNISELYPFVCQRIGTARNYSVVVNDLTFYGQSPVVVRLDQNDPDRKDLTYNAVVSSVDLAQLNLTVVVDRVFYTREQLKEPLQATWPQRQIVSKWFTFETLSPYKIWSYPTELDYLYKWKTSSGDVAEHRLRGQSSMNHTFDKVVTLNVEIIVTDGRSQVEFLGMLQIVCGGAEINVIDMRLPYNGAAVEGYHQLILANSTHMHEATIGYPLFLADAPAYFLMETKYPGIVMSPSCDGTWMQYKGDEYILFPSPADLTYEQAQQKCFVVGAEVARFYPADREKKHLLMLLRSRKQYSGAVWLTVGESPTAMLKEGDLRDESLYIQTAKHAAMCQRPSGATSIFRLVVDDGSSIEGQSPVAIVLSGRKKTRSASEVSTSRDVHYYGTISSPEMEQLGQVLSVSVEFYVRYRITGAVAADWQKTIIVGDSVNITIGSPFNNWPYDSRIRFIYRWTDSEGNQTALSNDSSLMRTFTRLSHYDVKVIVTDDRSEVTMKGPLDVICGATSLSIPLIKYPYDGQPINGLADLRTAEALPRFKSDGKKVVLANYAAHFFVQVDYPGFETCKHTWLESGGIEYHVGSMMTATFQEAKDICGALNAVLSGLTLTDVATRDFLALVRSIQDPNRRTMWLDVGSPMAMNEKSTKIESRDEDEKHSYMCERASLRAKFYTVTINKTDGSVLDVPATTSPVQITLDELHPNRDNLYYVARLTSYELAQVGIIRSTTASFATRQELVHPVTGIWQYVGLKDDVQTFTVAPPYTNWTYPQDITFVAEWFDENGTSLEGPRESPDPKTYKSFIHNGFYKVVMKVTDKCSEVTYTDKLKIMYIDHMQMNVSFPFNTDGSLPTAPVFVQNLTLAGSTHRFTVWFGEGTTDQFGFMANRTDDADRGGASSFMYQIWNGTGEYSAVIPEGRWRVELSEKESPLHLSVAYTLEAIPKVPTIVINPMSDTTRMEKKQLRLEMMRGPTVYDCMVVDYGDESVMEKWGHSGFCSNWRLWNDLPRSSHKGQAYRRYQIIDHVYETSSGFTVTVYLHNFVSESKFSTWFFVYNDTCFRPLVQMLGAETNSERAIDRHCGEPIVISNLIDIGCSYTTQVAKSWQVEQVSPVSLSVTKSFNLERLVTDKNEIELPPRFACMGLLRITFKAQMEPSALPFDMREVSTTVYTYLNVRPSPIQAKLMPGSIQYVTLGTTASEMLVLHPNLHSVNPNEHFGAKNRFDRFQYLCRKVNPHGAEWYRRLPDGSYNMSNPSRPSGVAPRSVYGCFGGGPGALTLSGGYEKVSGRSFKPGYVYEIRVIITKTYTIGEEDEVKLTSEGFIRVNVLAGTPLKPLIRCSRPEFCIAEGNGLRVSPTQPMSLVCRCENCAPSAVLAYEWKADNNFGAIDSARLPGHDSSVVKVDNSLWSNASVTHLDYECSVADSSNKKTGRAVAVLIPNTAPTGGTCNVLQPRGGKEFERKFEIICAGWRDNEDPDDSLTYEFQLVDTGLHTTTTLYKGPISRHRFHSSKGTFNIRVFVSDPLGEVTESKGGATTIRVARRKLNELQASSLLARTSGEGNRDTLSTINLLLDAVDRGAKPGRWESDIVNDTLIEQALLRRYGDPYSGHTFSTVELAQRRHSNIHPPLIDPLNNQTLIDPSTGQLPNPYHPLSNVILDTETAIEDYEYPEDVDVWNVTVQAPTYIVRPVQDIFADIPFEMDINALKIQGGAGQAYGPGLIYRVNMLLLYQDQKTPVLDEKAINLVVPSASKPVAPKNSLLVPNVLDRPEARVLDKDLNLVAAINLNGLKGSAPLLKSGTFSNNLRVSAPDSFPGFGQSFYLPAASETTAGLTSVDEITAAKIQRHFRDYSVQTEPLRALALAHQALQNFDFGVSAIGPNTAVTAESLKRLGMPSIMHGHIGRLMNALAMSHIKPSSAKQPLPVSMLPLGETVSGAIPGKEAPPHKFQPDALPSLDTNALGLLLQAAILSSSEGVLQPPDSQKHWTPGLFLYQHPTVIEQSFAFKQAQEQARIQVNGLYGTEEEYNRMAPMDPEVSKWTTPDAEILDTRWVKRVINSLTRKQQQLLKEMLSLNTLTAEVLVQMDRKHIMHVYDDHVALLKAVDDMSNYLGGFDASTLTTEQQHILMRSLKVESLTLDVQASIDPERLKELGLRNIEALVGLNAILLQPNSVAEAIAKQILSGKPFGLTHEQADIMLAANKFNRKADSSNADSLLPETLEALIQNATEAKELGLSPKEVKALLAVALATDIQNQLQAGVGLSPVEQGAANLEGFLNFLHIAVNKNGEHEALASLLSNLSPQLLANTALLSNLIWQPDLDATQTQNVAKTLADLQPSLTHPVSSNMENHFGGAEVLPENPLDWLPNDLYVGTGDAGYSSALLQNLLEKKKHNVLMASVLGGLNPNATKEGLYVAIRGLIAKYQKLGVNPKLFNSMGGLENYLNPGLFTIGTHPLKTGHQARLLSAIQAKKTHHPMQIMNFAKRFLGDQSLPSVDPTTQNMFEPQVKRSGINIGYPTINNPYLGNPLFGTFGAGDKGLLRKLSIGQKAFRPEMTYDTQTVMLATSLLNGKDVGGASSAFAQIMQYGAGSPYVSRSSNVRRHHFVNSTAVTSNAKKAATSNSLSTLNRDSRESGLLLSGETFETSRQRQLTISLLTQNVLDNMLLSMKIPKPPPGLAKCIVFPKESLLEQDLIGDLDERVYDDFAPVEHKLSMFGMILIGGGEPLAKDPDYITPDEQMDLYGTTELPITMNVDAFTVVAITNATLPFSLIPKAPKAGKASGSILDVKFIDNPEPDLGVELMDDEHEVVAGYMKLSELDKSETKRIQMKMHKIALVRLLSGKEETMPYAQAQQLLAMTQRQQQQAVNDENVEIPGRPIGTILLSTPDQIPKRIILREDTIAIKIVNVSDRDSKKRMQVPLSLGALELLTVQPEHLFTADGHSVLDQMPGAPKWASVPEVAHAILALDTIILPTTQQACDHLKIPHSRVLTSAMKACLRKLKKQHDVLNNAIGSVNHNLLMTLTETSTQPSNVVSKLKALGRILSSATTTSIDVERGVAIPQLTMSLETTGVALKELALYVSALRSAKLTVDESKEAAMVLLETMADLTRAQIIAHLSPLEKDRVIGYLRARSIFDSALPKDYSQRVRVDELTAASWGTYEAKKKARLQAELAMAAFGDMTTFIDKALLPDVSQLEVGKYIFNGVKIPDYPPSESSTNVGNYASYFERIGLPAQVVQRPIGDVVADNYQIEFPPSPCDYVQVHGCDDKQLLRVTAAYFKNNYVGLTEHEKDRQVNTGMVNLTFSDPRIGKALEVDTTARHVAIGITFKRLGPMPRLQDYHPDVERLVERMEYMSVHQVEIEKDNVSLVIQARPLDDNMTLGLYFAFGPPGVRAREHRLWVAITPRMLNNTLGYRRHTWVISQKELGGYKGSVYIGVGRIMPEWTPVDVENGTTVAVNGVVFNRNFSKGYRMRVVSKGCYYYDVRERRWSSKGVQVDHEHSVDAKYVRCVASHLSLFSAGLFAPASTVEFDYIFNNHSFEQNISVYVALVALAVGFFILVVWALWQDQVDRSQIGSMPLLDNHPADKYIYEIIVFTGYKKGAATDSKVSFIVFGDKGDSDTRRMMSDENHKKIFRNGAVDSFIMTTRRPLGKLQYLRLWHDNKGRGSFKSWFCEKAVIVDCQTGDRYPFMVNKWLACDEEDGLIWVGLLASLVVTPVGSFLAFLFRHSRLRTVRPNRIAEALEKQDIAAPPPAIDQRAMRERAMNGRFKNDPCSCPFVFRWFAWLLALIAIAVSVLFLVWHVLDFSDETTRQWLTSMVVSFVAFLLLIEPAKMFLFVVFFSCICKRWAEVDEDFLDEDEVQLELQPDEEYLKPAAPGDTLMPTTLKGRGPDEHVERLQERRMFELIWDFLLYLAFVWVVLVMTYGNRDTCTFQYQNSIKDIFTGTWTENPNLYFNNIRSSEDFWNWCRFVLVPASRAQWYNETHGATDLQGFAMDKTSRMIAYPVIRQIRHNEDHQCTVHDKVEHLFDHCTRAKGRSSEDHRDYALGWTELGTGVEEREEYRYTSWDRLNALPVVGRLSTYSGGGYVASAALPWYEQLAKFAEMEAFNWIDNGTRAVIVEFALYNAQINMFAHCALLLETPSTGQFEASARFEPVRLYRYHSSGYGKSLMLYEIAFCAFIIFFLLRELARIKSADSCGRYLSQFWSWVELGIVGFGTAAMVFYALRQYYTEQLDEQLEETQLNAFVKVQKAAMMDEAFTYLQALVMFLTNVKLFRMLRLNKRMGMLMDTLRRSRMELFGFTLMFAIVYMAFCSAFYLLLGRELYAFSDYVFVLQEAFSAMLGKFHFYNMLDTSHLAPWFFFVFMVVQSVILVNMLVTIVTNFFLEVKSDMLKRQNEYELLDMMMTKLRVSLGIGMTDEYRRHMLDARVDTTATDTLDERTNRLVKRVNRATDLRTIDRHARHQTLKQHQDDRRLLLEKY